MPLMAGTLLADDVGQPNLKMCLSKSVVPITQHNFVDEVPVTFHWLCNIYLHKATPTQSLASF